MWCGGWSVLWVGRGGCVAGGLCEWVERVFVAMRDFPCIWELSNTVLGEACCTWRSLLYLEKLVVLTLLPRALKKRGLKYSHVSLPPPLYS